MMDVVVIGGGAAGMMTAGLAAERGKSVLLIEKNPLLGKKLRITGKGRCNLTNLCDQETFLMHVSRNSRFLYSALSKFSPQDAMSFFEELGVALKVERGNRVFPDSDSAVDVAHALEFFCKSHAVKFLQGTVKEVWKEDNQFYIDLGRQELVVAKCVVLATGGCSYPSTGSTGDGYRFAASLGHKIISPKPSLVPLLIRESVCKRMQGLSLRNVVVTVFHQTTDKVIYSNMGEMLFTHFGVSGPLILAASAYLSGTKGDQYYLEIDLKPALSAEQLDERFLREVREKPNRDFINLLKSLLPAKMIPVFAELSDVPFHQKVNQITKEQRRHICFLLKHFRMHITGMRPVEEAIITDGGVDIAEISPKTMESKIAKGLFVVGELLDVNALTGGYNLQIAWSTAFAAGQNV